MRKWIILIIVLLIAIWVISKPEATEPYIEVEKPLEALSEPNRAISDWVSDLAKMENCPLEGMVDVNGLKSYGPFCFQEATYLGFVKRYKIYPYSTDAELLSNLGDAWTQEVIVRRMIEENEDIRRHWYTSVVVRGLGTPEL